MNLNEATRTGLGVAIDAADLVGVAVDPATRTAIVTFLVPVPADGECRRARDVQLLLHPVARVAASLRHGAPHGRAATVVAQSLGDLPATVRSFGGMPVHGCGFFDAHETGLAQWGDRLSLDWRSGRGAGRHSLTLCQDAADRRVDLCIWFDDLEVLDGRGFRIPVASFIADGRECRRASRARGLPTAGRGQWV